MHSKINTVLACLALLVATAGVGSAASGLIGSKQIANHSIKMVDLSSSAVSGLRGQQGPRGPQGPMGPQGLAGTQGLAGAAGVAGAAGGFDPSKISYVTGPDTVIAAGQLGGAYAVCPVGSKVLGGGLYESIGEAFGSTFTTDGNAWVAAIDNTSSIAITVNAYAVCAAK